MEIWQNKETIFKGNVFSVISGTVKTNDNQRFKRDVVKHDGGVAIVPFFENYIYLIKQFRISINNNILEIPAGRLESANESALTRATIELQEETGFIAKNMLKVAEYYSSVGFTDEIMHIFIATDLVQDTPKTEPDEHIQVVKYKIDEIESMISSGKIIDSKTIIGIFYLLNKLRDHSLVL